MKNKTRRKFYQIERERLCAKNIAALYLFKRGDRKGIKGNKMEIHIKKNNFVRKKKSILTVGLR